jgi:hypothetical protein
MAWASGEDLSPSNLNNKSASATSSTGYSTNSLQAESGNTVLVGTSVHLTPNRDLYFDNGRVIYFRNPAGTAWIQGISGTAGSVGLVVGPAEGTTGLDLLLISSGIGDIVLQCGAVDQQGTPMTYQYAPRYQFEDAFTRNARWRIGVERYAGTANTSGTSLVNFASGTSFPASTGIRFSNASISIGATEYSVYTVLSAGSLLVTTTVPTATGAKYVLSGHNLSFIDSGRTLRPLYIRDADHLIQTDYGLALPSNPPTSGISSGSTGELRWGIDSGTTYFYACTSTDSWARTALTPF